jgi:hypothetical protein
MKRIAIWLITLLLVFFLGTQSYSQNKNVISVDGTRFTMNGRDFEFLGISFFNALYNPAFNKNSEERRNYIRQFNEYGINVLRIWCQWNNTRGFADSGGEMTLFNKDGSLNNIHLANLKSIIEDADKERSVILLVLFSRESWNENLKLDDIASDRAVGELTRQLKPYRNLIFQVWNEFNYRTLDYLKIIRKIDNDRLVTNSPGYAGELGSIEENNALDYLSPHTTRDDERHWEVAAEEVSYLLKKFGKPVVDDEPARKGTSKYGGPKNPVIPTDQIIHIYNTWKAGGYIIYHHDMFQTGYGSEAVPVNGIPAPGFSSYHDYVFNFLRDRSRYLKNLRQD